MLNHSIIFRFPLVNVTVGLKLMAPNQSVQRHIFHVLYFAIHVYVNRIQISFGLL